MLAFIDDHLFQYRFALIVTFRQLTQVILQVFTNLLLGLSNKSEAPLVTGQSGRQLETGRLEEGLSAQTHRMLANIDAILNASGCRREDIVKVTLLLTEIKDFKAVDQIYASWLPGRGVTPLPARTALQAAALPAGALVMMDVVAACPDMAD